MLPQGILGKEGRKISSHYLTFIVFKITLVKLNDVKYVNHGYENDLFERFVFVVKSVFQLARAMPPFLLLPKNGRFSITVQIIVHTRIRWKKRIENKYYTNKVRIDTRLEIFLFYFPRLDFRARF